MFDIKGSLFLGKYFIDLSSVASTNEYAAQLLAKGTVLNGTIVSTFNQTKGKGSHNNQWISKAQKNISISLILYPQFLNIAHQFYLNIAICVGITDFLHKNFNQCFKIKWPNDIYYQNQKLGGLLIENVIQGNQLKSSTVGIGLNINQMEFPAHLPNPVSLKQITHTTFELYTFLEKLIPIIEQRYLQLEQGAFKTLKSVYLERLYRFGEAALYTFDGQTQTGCISDIDKQGKLVIVFDDDTRAFGFKEVVFCEAT